MLSIVTALIPFAAPLIKRLIGGAEESLGPGTGRSKMSAVMSGFKAFQEQLYNEKKIPGKIDDDNILGVIIEFILHEMKDRGEISDKPKNSTGPWSFTVPAGTTITVDQGGK
jgi:hypothetical protein